MRIYLAARYSRRTEMQEIAERLRKYGCIVTSRWIEGRHDGMPDKQCAEEDVRDVIAADVLISFTNEPRTPTRGGRHVEFGIALHRSMRLIIVGPREHVFHYLGKVEHFETTEEMMEALFAEFKIAADLIAAATTCELTDEGENVLRSPAPAAKPALFDNGSAPASAVAAIKGR